MVSVHGVCDESASRLRESASRLSESASRLSVVDDTRFYLCIVSVSVHSSTLQRYDKGMTLPNWEAVSS